MTPQDLKYVVCTTLPRFCGGFNAKCGNTHHYRSRMELCNPILTLLGHNVVTSCLKKYTFQCSKPVHKPLVSLASTEEDERK